MYSTTSSSPTFTPFLTYYPHHHPTASRPSSSPLPILNSSSRIYDLHIISAEQPLQAPFQGADVSKTYVEVVRMLLRIPLISIAEINGQAFGAGNELFVQMDMRFAGPKTRLGSLEVGLGVFAGSGELQLSTKLLGRTRTLEYLLSSGTADATEAERIGWVNKAFSSVEAMQEHVARLVERIASFSAVALAAHPETQRAVNECLKRSNDQREGDWELGLNHNLVELWPKGSS